MSTQRLLFPWLALALLVILCDQLSKILIVQSLSYGESIPVTHYFNWVLVYNTGAAFSFLAQAGGWQRYFFIALGSVAAVWMVYLLAQHGRQKLFAFSLSLMMGGALGNVIDRLWHGHVIDFLDFYWGTWHWPAFNLADSAITLGVILLVVDELRRVRSAR